MVSCEWYRNATLVIRWILFDYDSSRVTDICQEKTSAIVEHTDACASTVPNVSPHLGNFLISLEETIDEGLLHPFKLRLCLCIVVFQLHLEMVFQKLG